MAALNLNVLVIKYAKQKSTYLSGNHEGHSGSLRVAAVNSTLIGATVLATFLMIVKYFLLSYYFNSVCLLVLFDLKTYGFRGIERCKALLLPQIRYLFRTARSGHSFKIETV